jgi:hypothetical protein
MALSLDACIFGQAEDFTLIRIKAFHGGGNAC